ncbi:LacI family transcriptional regulator [Dolosicoccus paucivorans]|uniref:LacI family transcriptional regulator n=1 Tax=Dolosicoccus paucivorans TaxID=84521 RepID=A0A2N6SLU0_9LACT|nr:LacI family DNA-binding transcriptional regulator [Dolosicoccus paucivorans]PMB83888.1 LacI family transcriptional regulator [Dolosicoccus paucivorans]PMC58030.1 LacI family transcriptional regulator [Dolosicoccus paucivorans]
MKVTIKDVAKLAGVSPATVSRVIGDHPAITKKTQQKVREAMKEVGYYPNLNARRLASKKAHALGIVLPTETDNFYQNPFFPTVLRGINNRASRKEYALQLSMGHTVEERLDHVRKMVYGMQVDGIIFLYANKNDKIIQFVRQANMPYVIIGYSEVDSEAFVDNDNHLAGYEVTKELIDKGYQRIGYLGTDGDFTFVNFRKEGYAKAMKEAGLEEKVTLGLTIDQEVSPTWWDGVDSLVIADELLAQRVAWQMLESGVQLPIYSFSSYHNPLYENSRFMTFKNMDAQSLGRQAVDILFKSLNKKSK